MTQRVEEHAGNASRDSHVRRHHEVDGDGHAAATGDPLHLALRLPGDLLERDVAHECRRGAIFQVALHRPQAIHDGHRPVRPLCFGERPQRPEFRLDHVDLVRELQVACLGGDALERMGGQGGPVDLRLGWGCSHGERRDDRRHAAQGLVDVEAHEVGAPADVRVEVARGGVSLIVGSDMGTISTVSRCTG